MARPLVTLTVISLFTQPPGASSFEAISFSVPSVPMGS